MNFSVDNEARLNFGCVNVGMTPGRFDAKQIVLVALIVMAYEVKGEFLRIIRTIDKNELSKCSFFITDGFANKFPNIPSYNNISKVWDIFGEEIAKNIYSSVDPKLSAMYSKSKICEIEKFDILLEYNTSFLCSENENVKFKQAVQSAISMITEIVKSSSIYAKSHYTVMSYIEECENDVLYLPFDIAAKQIVIENAPDIKWLITKESEEIYTIESTDNNVDIRHIIKDRKEVIYAGRFFCKVTSLEIAKALIENIRRVIKKAA